LFRGYKPEWLYEALPFIYIGSGLACISVVRNSGGLISGLLLISAGSIVWKLRRDHRRRGSAGALQIRDRREAQKETSPPRKDTSAPQKDTSALPARVEWRPDFEVGHELIDRQHRRLFALTNEVIDGLRLGKPDGDIELMLDDLIMEVKNHFHAEEDINASQNALLAKAHDERHRELLMHIAKMHEGYHRGSISTSEIVSFLVNDVVSQHLITEDLDFFGSSSSGKGSSAILPNGVAG